MLLNCSTNETELVPKLDDNNFEVSAELAIATAKISFLTNGQNFVKRKETTAQYAKKAKIVDQATAVTDEKGQTLLHIINYKDDQGWAMVAGDERIVPILAYSDQGTFNLGRLPDGVNEWFVMIKKEAKRIKDSKEKIHPAIKKLWLKHTAVGGSTNRLPSPDDPTGCPPDPDPIDKDDFLKTPTGDRIQFGQGAGYNRHVPTPVIMTGNCACNIPPAGCGPVAVAQIMTYFGKKGILKPSGYDFVAIPSTLGSAWQCSNETDGQTQLAMLIRRIYYNSNASYVPWACNSVTLPGQLGQVFGMAGYTNTGGWSDNRWTGAEDLAAGYPIMYWGTKGGFNLNDAHIWVSSGIQKTMTYSMLDGTTNCILYGPEYRYMNWGWNGNSNGWYSVSMMNPGGGNPYDTWLDVYKNIRP